MEKHSTNIYRSKLGYLIRRAGPSVSKLIFLINSCFINPDISLITNDDKILIRSSITLWSRRFTNNENAEKSLKIAINICQLFANDKSFQNSMKLLVQTTEGFVSYIFAEVILDNYDINILSTLEPVKYSMEFHFRYIQAVQNYLQRTDAELVDPSLLEYLFQSNFLFLETIYDKFLDENGIPNMQITTLLFHISKIPLIDNQIPSTISSRNFQALYNTFSQIRSTEEHDPVFLKQILLKYGCSVEDTET